MCDKVVRDKVVCERERERESVCERLCVTKLPGGGGGGEAAERRGGYRTKNKNPAQRCGEQRGV